MTSLEGLKRTLASRYPEIGLTVGYLGNVERWGDERSWMFFTKVGNPGDTWGNSHGFHLGSTESMRKRLENPGKLRNSLVSWIVDRVLPDAKEGGVR